MTEQPGTNAEHRELTIEKLVYGGDGLARADGQVVLTPFVLPGERIRARVSERKPGFERAVAESVLEPSPLRQAAPCPHFGSCGGCHYQHALYETQLEQKVAILREVFQRVGKMAAPERIDTVAGPPMGYRNRAQFHLEGGRIGFHEAGSRTIRPVEFCAVCSPKLNDAYARFARLMPDRRFPRFLRSVELFTSETEVQLNVLESERPLARVFFEWCAEAIDGLVSGPLVYPAAGYRFRVSHGAFFQVNRFLMEQLVETALRGAEGETALDLYAGVGLFSLPLAARFASVTAVESGVSACRDLTHNATQAGLKIATEQTSVEEYLKDAPPADFILADPPRAGLGKHVTRLLAERAPKRLTVVSCDPATLARDLAALAGSFEVEQMTLIDLFPQTYHIETVTALRRR